MNDSVVIRFIRAYSDKRGKPLPYDTIAASEGSFRLVSDGVKKEIPAGCAAYIPENSGCFAEGEKEICFISFEAVIYGNLSLFSLYDLPDVLGEDVAAAVIDAAKIAEKQFFTSVIENEIEMKKLMWNAVSAAIKQSQPIEAQADIAGRHRVFAPVFEYIADHAGEMISLEKLIPLTDFSKDSFYRAFKKTVGMPPRDYMLYQRLLYARRLLFTTDLSVKEISEKAGYTSPSAFGAVFVEKYGTSPKRYRTSVKKQ